MKRKLPGISDCAKKDYAYIFLIKISKTGLLQGN